ncbi:CPBP family intramembrane metalloprotease [Microbispora triticiradicis]|uniref:CPBP family intramembrane metalloprotease n=1 Tax=Microbispora triticiradicis TaxID=2200763 RepID=A0ABX9LPU1_9ACTN|nr:CPBP family glutamic-type intramembrane protease [Microbispora triticiradicis]RGA05992.1 CPBP family intramembrane metalloprotease [Microbispora triticiradicis]GLW22013.1 abortive infection protein [Microbispora amethystogenes]
MRRTIATGLGVLAAANLLNNRVARRWAPVTSAAATGALLLIARRAGLTRHELGFRDARAGAATGGALAAAVAAGYAAGVALPRTRPLFHDQRALALSRRRVLEEALVQVPFGTVLLEEVGFRGVLPALLGRVLPARTAVAASAALFGVWHVLPALDMARANPALGRLTAGEDPAPGDGRRGGVEAGRLVAGTVASTALAGLVFHGLRHRAGLLAPALLHVATNSLGYAAARAARRLDDRSAGPAAPLRR